MPVDYGMCIYSENRGETIISYLYGELDPAERTRFTGHLAACRECAQELAELGAVRSQLAQWTPPEPKQLVGDAAVRSPTPRWWHTVPAWAQVAAALLILGVAARVANLEVRYDADGFVARTGWAVPADTRAPAGTAARADAEPWRIELAALEQRLTAQARPAAAPAPSDRPRTDDALLRRMGTLLAESERRQQRELALRIAGVMRDLDAQRQADLVKIDRSIGALERNTGVEVMRQGQMLNYLVRTAQAR